MRYTRCDVTAAQISRAGKNARGQYPWIKYRGALQYRQGMTAFPPPPAGQGGVMMLPATGRRLVTAQPTGRRRIDHVMRKHQPPLKLWLDKPGCRNFFIFFSGCVLRFCVQLQAPPQASPSTPQVPASVCMKRMPLSTPDHAANGCR